MRRAMLSQMLSAAITVTRRAAGILVGAFAAQAQEPTTGTTNEVRLEIDRTTNLQVTSLDFGILLTNGDDGSVAMNSAAGLTFTGDLLETVDGPHGAASVGPLIMDASAGTTAKTSMNPLVTWDRVLSSHRPSNARP